MRSFDDEDLTGAEFRERDLSGARMVGVVMQDSWATTTARVLVFGSDVLSEVLGVGPGHPSR